MSKSSINGLIIFSIEAKKINNCDGLGMSIHMMPYFSNDPSNQLIKFRKQLSIGYGHDSSLNWAEHKRLLSLEVLRTWVIQSEHLK